MPEQPLTEAAVVLAIDPGSERSAWLTFDTDRQVPLEHGIVANDELAEFCRHALPGQDIRQVVIEKVESFGMSVGAEVFETVFWSGRFAEAAGHVAAVTRLGRIKVKNAICHSSRATDSNIRQALIDRYGGAAAIGRKAAPGPLYGIAKDVWQALALAVTFAELDAAA